MRTSCGVKRAWCAGGRASVSVFRDDDEVGAAGARGVVVDERDREQSEAGRCGHSVAELSSIP